MMWKVAQEVKKQEQKKMNAIVLLLLFRFYLLDVSSFFTTLP
ncbi:hypothetical protein HMPREF1212_03424 [Parabacteroides sp. HGS0025]|jgi:hypothetical protein|nr:hypothetical protein HMPREF1212_03424 [Parabacteroides sp. HGS0025]